MVSTYSFYEKEKFSGDDYSKQVDLPGSTKTAKVSLKIEAKEKIDSQYQRYDVEFNEIVKQRGVVFDPNTAEPMDFDFYLDKNTFSCYESLNDKWLFFNTSYRTTDRLLRQIRGLESGRQKSKNDKVSVIKKQVDLSKLIQLSKLNTAWFKIVDDPNVSSSSISGSSITKSNYYSSFLNHGSISAISILFKHNGESYLCTVSKNASVTFYDNIDTIKALEVSKKIISIIV